MAEDEYGTMDWFWKYEPEASEFFAGYYGEKIRALEARLAELDREIVICAAIRLPDGRVIRGHRHDGCILYAKAMVDYEAKPGNGAGPAWHPSMCREQGFVTSRNRYVDRYDGMRLQIAAGLIAEGRSGQQLFSEDLY